MKSKIALAFATFALAVASAAAASTYHVTLSDKTWVGGTELKAGDYKVSVEGDKATLKAGKTVVEAPVKVENGTEKFSNTSVAIDNSTGKPVVKEIRVGGSTTKIVFQGATSPANGTE